VTATNKEHAVPEHGEAQIDRAIIAYDQLSNWLVADDYEALAVKLAFDRRKVIAPLVKIREPLGAASAELCARLADPADLSSPEINQARATLAVLNEKFLRDCGRLIDVWTPTPGQSLRCQ
jgi:hypothetical protein